MIGIADIDSLAVNDRQLMAKLVAQIAFVANVDHGTDEVAVVFVGVFTDHAVVPLITADRPVRPPLEFAAEMGKDLQGTTSCAAFFIAAALLSGMSGASRQTFKCGEFTSLTILSTS